MEMRKSIELEKERALWRLRKQLEHKFKKIIEETKKKQWVIFLCCLAFLHDPPWHQELVWVGGMKYFS